MRRGRSGGAFKELDGPRRARGQQAGAAVCPADRAHKLLRLQGKFGTFSTQPGVTYKVWCSFQIGASAGYGQVCCTMETHNPFPSMNQNHCTARR